MTRSTSRNWLWPGIAVAALAGIIAARYVQRQQRSADPAIDAKPASAAQQPSGATATATDSPSAPADEQLAEQLAAQLAELLEAADWPADAAAAVAALNADYLAMVGAEDPSHLDRVARTLAPLGKHKGVMDVIRRRPETAGLLAAAPRPDEIAETLRIDQRYSAASNVYARHIADSGQVAEALDRHGALISRLIDEGMVGAETVFLYPRDSEGARIYDRWLASAFESAMTDERQLAALFQLVLVQGQALRRRMIDDPQFGLDVETTVWPRLQRLDERGVVPLELAALDIQLFELLRRPEGERLVSRWGLVPLEFLYGERAYRPALQPALIETLLAADNETLYALEQMRDEPLLAELLAREDIDGQVKAAALTRLQAAGSDYPSLLREYSELKSPTALRDAVGPPPSGPITWVPLYYTVYEVPKKILQGRNPTMMDAVIAVLDPVFLVAGPLGPDDIIKVTGQQALRGTQKSAGRAVASSLKSAAQGQATRQLGARAAGGLAARESAPWLVSQMLRGTRTAVRQKLKSQMTVDITGPTRFLFRVTGVGRQSFRRLTGLEARVLMRADRRVLIRLDRFLIGHPAGRFLADTAVAGLVETGAETETVENAVAGVVRGVERFPDQVSGAKSQFSAWQKNMSAWWLSHATGMWSGVDPEYPADGEHAPLDPAAAEAAAAGDNAEQESSR